MSRLIGTVSVLAVLLAAAADAGAQSVSATTGAINGKVSDSTGSVLPGVTVTVASPSMQGTRTAVTNEDGAYRFPAVPPGEYKITYELAGFGTVVRDRVRVGLGFTATLNIEMAVASLQETVTVSGESPVVDVSSTKTTTNFGAAELASLPSARDYWSILAAAPAVVVQRIDIGGSAAGTQTAYSAYDTKSDQHRPMVEGIVNTEGTNAAGYYYDYGSMDEVSIGTGGNTAEMPWPGVLSQFIAKSGGNQYHGKVYLDYQNKAVQSTNIDAEQGAQIARVVKLLGGLQPSDLNRMEKYYDVNGDVGGYIQKDRLWWYGSLRDQDIQSLLPNFPVKPFETHLRNVSGKGTYALTKNNKLIGYGQWGQKAQPNRMDRFLVAATVAIHNSAESTWKQQYWAHTYKGEWDSVINDAMFFEVRGGQFRYIWPNYRYTESPAYEDIGNNIVSGGNRDGWFNIPSRNQVLGSLSYFKDNWAGSHNFKFGGEMFRETFTYKRGEGVSGVVPGDVLHVLRNGAPAEVLLMQSPSISENGLWSRGLYASDTWRVSDRLTFMLGLRFDSYRSFLPAQEHPTGRFTPTAQSFAAVDNLLSWKLPAPRVGATFNVSGDGKTVLKASYGQFWWNPGTALAEQVNTNPPDWYKRYTWTDRNLNNLWDPGEEGTLTAQRGGTGSAVLDPDLKDTRTREAAFWLEREVFSGFGVHAGYVWRRIDQLQQLDNLNRPYSAFNVPVSIPDPGPDGVRGNADDGPAISGFNLDPAYVTKPVVNVRHNAPGVSNFHNIELSGTKRASHGWSFNGSFAIRWNRDNDTGYFGNNLRANQAPSNPNDIINTDGGRYNFTTWSAKFHGTWDGPWGIRMTPALRYQAGQAFGRTILASMNYGSQRILTEPISSRRQDNVWVLDGRFEKVVKLAGARSAGLFLDLYNLTNSNAATNITWGSGSTFLVPATIIGPRIARFGVRFDW